MALDFAEDLTEMLSTDDHGVTVVYSGNTFTGILNREFMVQDVGGAGAASTEPAVYCKTSDVSGAVEGEAITVDGTGYIIGGTPEPDDLGLTRIPLFTT